MVDILLYILLGTLGVAIVMAGLTLSALYMYDYSFEGKKKLNRILGITLRGVILTLVTSIVLIFILFGMLVMSWT